MSAPDFLREPPVGHFLKQHHSVAGHHGAGGPGPFAEQEGQLGHFSTPLTLFLLCLASKYNPLNLTELDWSLLSKKECLNYGGRLLGNSCQFIPDLALMSFILFFGTYSMTLTLKKFKFSRYFPTKVSYPALRRAPRVRPFARSP